jgi:hypothetical protein
MEIRELGKNDVIHCSTLEEALAICQLMHNSGFKWSSGRTYLEDNKYSDNFGDTCYRPYVGAYTSMGHYKRNDYNVIPASVFLGSNNYEIY